jgi:uncharacterized protein (DUF2062 family)
MGIQTYLAIPIAALFKVNKVAPAVTFIYGANYWIGAKLLGCPLKAPFISNPSWETFWHSSRSAFLCLTVGGVLTGIAVAIAGYFLTLAMVKSAREKARRLRRKIAK